MAAWILSYTLCCRGPDTWLTAEQRLHCRACQAPWLLLSNCRLPRNFPFHRGWVWQFCTTLGHSGVALAVAIKYRENSDQYSVQEFLFSFCFLSTCKNIIVADRAYIYIYVTTGFALVLLLPQLGFAGLPMKNSCRTMFGMQVCEWQIHYEMKIWSTQIYHMP